jgi:hypothetical protein
MKARILITATLATTFAGVLPAVDPHLLGLVMPDAKVLAGVNVVSAKNSPFGQYVLSQMAPKDQELQKMAVLTGFDPRQDLIELLAASNGATGSHAGLAMATGTFNPSAILAAATLAGATSETYKGATIIEDPNNAKGTPSGIAFLGSTIAIAGDLADVKAAIDRQSAPSRIDAGLASQASSLSANEDAWVVSLIGPPSATAVPKAAGGSGNPTGLLPANALQQIVSGSAGVKFGTNVVVTAQAQADNAQDATNLAGLLQLMANMAKLQADKNPQAASLANNLSVTSSGTTISVTFTLPADQLQALAAQPKAVRKPARAQPKK